MSATTVWQGLEERFKTVAGLGSVELGEPTGDMALPCLYTVYGSFERPLRNSPPAQNKTGMKHILGTRLVIQWVDFQAAERQLFTLVDLIPASIELDPHLGGRLNAGAAYCAAGVSGHAVIGGVTYRVVDYEISILEKI